MKHMKRILDFRFWILDSGNPKSKVQNQKSLASRSLQCLLLACCFSLLCSPDAFGCPGCKDALFDPGQLPQRLAYAKGYAMSIGLLLLVPVTLIGSIAALIIRAQHRRRASGASR